MNAAIHPDAVEIPNNGIDENCDGSDLMTSTKEEFGDDIVIYPNPAKEKVIISGVGTNLFLASLYDVNGQCIRKQKTGNELSLKNIVPGIYILRIDSGRHQNVVHRKIIVQ